MIDPFDGGIPEIPDFTAPGASDPLDATDPLALGSDEPSAPDGSGEPDDRTDPDDPDREPSEVLPTDSTAHDPFPSVGRHDEQGAALPPQILVKTDRGESSAVAIGKEEDGSVLVMGVEHGLGSARVGDDLKGAIVAADGTQAEQFDMHLVFIHSQHDRFFARIDAEIVEGWRQNYNTDLVVHTRVQAGEETAFTQQGGVYMPVLRHGVVGGIGDKDGGLLTLTGTEGTLGSSGAPVFDRAGHLVGQVVAYDPKNHVNLMSSAEQILDDIRDFRDGVNVAERAHPVSYSGAVAPIVRRGR